MENMKLPFTTFDDLEVIFDDGEVEEGFEIVLDDIDQED